MKAPTPSTLAAPAATECHARARSWDLQREGAYLDHMHDGSGGVPAAVRAGVGATVVMDASMLLAGLLAPRVLATDKLDVNLIGRWVGGLGRGIPAGGDITGLPAVRGETALGFATHYLTGIALTQVYLAGARRAGVAPGPVTAIGFGVATAVLPLFVMFPSMGYGVAGRHSGDALRMSAVMLLGHSAFGAGIGLLTRTTRPRG